MAAVFIARFPYPQARGGPGVVALIIGAQHPGRDGVASSGPGRVGNAPSCLYIYGRLGLGGSRALHGPPGGHLAQQTVTLVRNFKLISESDQPEFLAFYQSPRFSAAATRAGPGNCQPNRLLHTVTVATRLDSDTRRISGKLVGATAEDRGLPVALRVVRVRPGQERGKARAPRPPAPSSERRVTGRLSGACRRGLCPPSPGLGTGRSESRVRPSAPRPMPGPACRRGSKPEGRPRAAQARAQQVRSPGRA